MKIRAFVASGALLRDMPSPRAVLADIHELKLDPTVAHTTRSSGRLAKPSRLVEESVVEVETVETVEEEQEKPKAEKPKPKPPQPKKKEAAKPEVTKVEEAKPEEKKEEDVSSDPLT